MNPITKKSLSRRSMLRGMGASISLPFLDAMVPAMAASTPASVKRLGFVFIPMGADMDRWTPKSKTDLSELSPILESLSSVKDKAVALTNLELQPAYPGSHATSNSAFLSAARAKLTESSDYFLGTTVDQVAAKAIGQTTKLPSLELCMDMLQTVGQCDNGYACVYQNNLSWSSPTTPLPAEAHPRLVFEKLFGEGGTREQRLASLTQRASLLDFIKEDMQSLKRELGKADRSRVDLYLESIREVERRIEISEGLVRENEEPDMDRPLGVPASYQDHARLMFDLQVLAMRGDITRVTSFQLAREASNRTYAEIGISDPHHPLSHHGNDVGKIERMSKINAFHFSLFTEYLEKLDAIEEGDGTLLDHSLLVYGSGMGDPNLHDHSNLPVVLAGGNSVGIKGNRHIRYDKPTPLANLHLTLLDKAGVRVDQFGDSDGMVLL